MTSPAPEARIRPEIGVDIHCLRKIKRVILQNLARAIGRSVGFLSQVERGLSELSANELQHICRYLVSGEFELWLTEQHFHLHAGDSFRLAGVPYRGRNPGDLSTVIIWVIAPPAY